MKLLDKFEIKDNLIFKADKIIAVFSIEPIDVFLLDQEEVEIFYERLSAFLNLLKGDIQFNTQIKQTKVEDFKEHFDSMRKASLKDKTLQDYVNSNIEDMKNMINDTNNISLTKKFYFQLSENVSGEKDNLIPEAIKTLESRFQRIYGSLIDAKLGIKQLKNNELNKYINDFLR